jgi:NADPH-dependent ferric siderophore reductase
MNIIEIAAKKLLRQATIIHKMQIARNVYHIRLQSRSFKNVSYRPGYFLRVFCGKGEDIARRDKARCYSVWNFNRADRTIDIAVVTHSGGPGANWAKLCQTGDMVYFDWFKSDLTIDHTGDHYLLLGDLTTLAHFYEINRNVPPDKNVDSLIYVENENDLFQDINGQTPLNFLQLSANPTDVIIEKLSAFLSQQGGKRIAYIGGDIRICQSVQRYFQQECQKAKGQIRIKPFWGPAMRALK